MSITGCRNDALVTLLNGLGYQPVMLPRTGLTPPELYVYKNEKLIRRGPLLDYLPPGSTIPALQRGRLDSIQHHQTNKKSLGVAASFLGEALKCVGITSAPKLDLSFAKGLDITFSFEDVTYEALDVAKIDHMLGDLRTGAIPPEDIKGGYLHIAYDYAFAGSLSMRTAGDASRSFDAKAIQMGTYLDLGTQGKFDVTDETTISFASKDGTPAAFAYKVGRLERRGKKWFFYPEEEAGENFLADEQEKEPCLLERGVVLRVEEEDDTRVVG
jgi:hypothetical protein